MTPPPKVNFTKAAADMARADYLDALFFKDGRDQVSHPFHGTYTGLYQKYTLQKLR
jgi:hypothetical protein